MSVYKNNFKIVNKLILNKNFQNFTQLYLKHKNKHVLNYMVCFAELLRDEQLC
jgi:hypothetical protein